MAFHLDGKTYRFPLLKLADPLSSKTAAEYRAQFDQQRRAYELLGRVDTMLNSLNSVRDSLVADKKALKPSDSTSGAKLQSAIDGIDALVATLTSSPQSFEDFIQKPGQLREDVLGLISDEPLAQASLTLYARLERDYAARTKSYDAWVATLRGVNATLKAAGEKPVQASGR
jgi:hypothetical protein